MHFGVGLMRVYTCTKKTKLPLQLFVCLPVCSCEYNLAWDFKRPKNFC